MSRRNFLEISSVAGVGLLIGFRLPDQASQQREWWTGEESTGASSHSKAWTLASRTASPNLMARTVAFDRGGG